MKRLSSFFLFISGLIFGASAASIYLLHQAGVSIVPCLYCQKQSALPEMLDDTEENIFNNILTVSKYTWESSNVVAAQEHVGNSLKKLAYVYWHQLAQNLTQNQKEKLMHLLTLLEQAAPMLVQNKTKDGKELSVEQQQVQQELFEEYEKFKVILEPVLYAYSYEKVRAVQGSDTYNHLAEFIKGVKYLRASLG